MTQLRNIIALAFLTPTLAACVSAGSGPIIVPDSSASRPAPRPSTNTIPPSNPLPPSTDRANPQIMRIAGLEDVIGAGAAQLERQFGSPQLDVREGDARKMQFAGEACVLDVFLYPTARNSTPAATHVEARRASDGRNVDRAACVRALRRR